MLDDVTLHTVLLNFDLFRENISLQVVERVLRQLFGKNWSSYYDAYRKRAFCLIVHDSTTSNSCNTPPSSNSAVWGMGYNLSFPSVTSQINGYAVMYALSTLDSIEKACKNREYSFIPGLIVDKCTQKIWVGENGRLLWYHCDDGDNLPPNIASCDRSHFKSDCQLILNGSHSKARAFLSPGMPSIEDSEWCIPASGHEIWDIAATPHPRCLWSTFESSLKDEMSDPLEVFSSDDIDYSKIRPVPFFVQDPVDGWMLPSRRPYLGPDKYSFVCRAGEFPAEEMFTAVRLVYLRHYGVIDMVQMSWLDFQGNFNLRHPRLSRDSSYLAAIVKTNHHDDDSADQFLLSIWRVELPHPVIVWPSGLRLCADSDYTISDQWLFTHCDCHGSTAYSLKCAFCAPVDITSCVDAAEPEPPLFFGVYGSRGNIVYCSGPECGSFSLFRLFQSSDSSWEAVPLYFPRRNSCLTAEMSSSCQLGADFSIQGITNSYLLTTTGTLFNFNSCTVEESSDGCAGLTLTPAPYTQQFEVVALHSLRDPTAAIAAVSVSSSEDDFVPTLRFLLLSEHAEHPLRCIRGPRIPSARVRTLVVSQDGGALFATCRDDSSGGWIAVFCSSSCSPKLPDQYYVLTVPEFASRFRSTIDMAHSHGSRSSNIGEDEGNRTQNPKYFTMQEPVFASKDTIVIRMVVQRVEQDEQQQPYTIFDRYFPYLTMVRFNAKSAWIEPALNAETKQLAKSVTGSGQTRKEDWRWVDVLQEEPRESDYCQIIEWLENAHQVAFSPGKRFVFYAAPPIPEIKATPHVEMRDLANPQLPQKNDFRRSWRSLEYFYRLSYVHANSSDIM